MDRFGPILPHFGRVRSVWRIGRGGSRSTFVEIDFFWLRECLGLDFAPPTPPSGASLTLLGRSLGLPDRSLGAPVGSKGAFCASLGATLDASALLGALGRPWDPRWLPGRFEDRFGVDLGSIFGRFRTDFGWIFFAVCTRLCSAGASIFRLMACSRPRVASTGQA